jgi:hypothetical protein
MKHQNTYRSYRLLERDRCFTRNYPRAQLRSTRRPVAVHGNSALGDASRNPTICHVKSWPVPREQTLFHFELQVWRVMGATSQHGRGIPEELWTNQECL